MDRELELKVLNIDLDEIEEKLISKEAKKLGVEIQKNHTFSPQNRTEFPNGYLRIREKTIDGKKSETELTFKESVDLKDDVRINNEYTTNISSTSNMIKILEEIGLVERYVGKKQESLMSTKDKDFALIHGIRMYIQILIWKLNLQILI